MLIPLGFFFILLQIRLSRSFQKDIYLFTVIKLSINNNNIKIQRISQSQKKCKQSLMKLLFNKIKISVLIQSFTQIKQYYFYNQYTLST